uniref:Malic enzyme n=1 Tax=Angiostrongylus cantonensis TaxID=6313 RepID=A0A0K0CVY8_ANGCA
LFKRFFIHSHKSMYQLYHFQGMAFTLHERQYLGIHGLLPPAFMTQEQQACRVMKQIRRETDNLEKSVLSMTFSYNKAVVLVNMWGLYITIDDNSISKIYQILSNWPRRDVKAIVVTDGERILGLGDLGAYGMGIPVGKLALYVALAGIQPQWCLPILIDVGTNNQKLLDNPFYTGLRRPRVRGAEYDQLIDNFMIAVTKRFGSETLIQFEDFGFSNAYTLIDRYKNDYCTFNDDIQGNLSSHNHLVCLIAFILGNDSVGTGRVGFTGTAAVAVAGLIATTRVTKVKLSQNKIVFFGAGEAGLGIAELCVRQMMDEGLTEEEARGNIFLLNSKGLITKDRAHTLTVRHQKFAKDLPQITSLLEVVKVVKANVLIGVSTVSGAFTPEILSEMAKINARPIVFALSNPTSKAECTAENAYRYTNGAALFASGSPFDDVEMNGKIYKPGQGNNSYIFPGVALAAVLFKAKRVPDKAFLIAARRCAASVTEESLNKYARIYPSAEEIRELSVNIAIDIGNHLYEKGLATFHPEPEDKELFIRQQLYSYEYEPSMNELYDWPETDCRVGFPLPESCEQH